MEEEPPPTPLLLLHDEDVVDETVDDLRFRRDVWREGSADADEDVTTTFVTVMFGAGAVSWERPPSRATEWKALKVCFSCRSILPRVALGVGTNKLLIGLLLNLGL